MNNLMTFFHESRVARFFMPAGIIFIFLGIIFFIINNSNKDYIETEAIVSKVEISQEAYVDVDDNYIEATYDVTVKYIVDGKEYLGQLGGLSKYNIGDKMIIYYNPSNPTQITQTKSIILPIIMIVGGIVSFVIGIISYTNTKKQTNG